MAATDLLDRDAVAHPNSPRHSGLIPDPRPHGYLEMLNLFRVVACLAVLSQHAFIWTNMTGNFVGTGFITMLHLSRTSFFFLTALVVTYAQIDHPRSTGEFWKRRYTQVGVPYLAWTGIYLVYSLITVHASWDEVGVFLRHNLFLGFSQMYFVIVIFEFYLLFPLLMKLLRSVNHGLVLAGSLAFATLIGLFLHYPTWFAPSAEPTSRSTTPCRGVATFWSTRSSSLWACWSPSTSARSSGSSRGTTGASLSVPAPSAS